MTAISPYNATRCTFTIQGRLPGLNEITRANRANMFQGAKLKKDATQLCGQAIIVDHVPVFKNPPLSVLICWYEKDNRRDIDNVAGGGTKFILDALVETGRIPNDGRKWVRSIQHQFPDPDKENPRILVCVEEIG